MEQLSREISGSSDFRRVPMQGRRCYRDTAEGASIPLTIVRGSDHRLLYANPAFRGLCTVEGVPAEGVPLAALFPAESGDIVNRLLDSVSASGILDSATEVRYLSGAEVRYASFFVTPAIDARSIDGDLVVQVVDSTASVQARFREAETTSEVREANQSLVVAGVREQQKADLASGQADELRHLLDSIQKLASIVETSSEGIAVISASGAFSYLNFSGQRLLGIEGADRIASTLFSELLIPEDLPLMRDVILPNARKGKWRGELRMRNGVTGEVVPMDSSVFSIVDPHHGGLLGIAVMMRDLREQKRREADDRRRADFEKQLVGIVSHDLATPISAILMSAGILRRIGGLDERQSGAVSRIITAGERVTRMTRELLDFTRARLGAGISISPVMVSFHGALTDVMEELRLNHEDREIAYTHKGDPDHGEWDPDRLVQLVSNLVNNAVAYSPRASQVQVRSVVEGKDAVLEVHNSGSPIPAALLPRLFEPLQRGAEFSGFTGRSIGLGLYIVKQVVIAHRGVIEVHSTETAGTTFRVRLPRFASTLAPPLHEG